MSTQPDTLHDRVTALIAKAEASVRASFPSATAERMIALDDTDARLTLGDLRAVLAETTTTLPEADAVERVARAMYEAPPVLARQEPWDEQLGVGRDWWLAKARAALAAAQPVEPEPDERALWALIEQTVQHVGFDMDSGTCSCGWEVDWTPVNEDGHLDERIQYARHLADIASANHPATAALIAIRDGDGCTLDREYARDALAALGVTVADTPVGS